MASYAYSSPVVAAYSSPVVQEVLKSEPEKAPTLSPPTGPTKTGYAAWDPALERDDDPVPTLMKLDGEEAKGDVRAEALVNQAKLLDLSTQHGQGPGFERDDPKHRIGELLVAAWNIYCKKMGRDAGERSDFFKWFDAIPELDRIMMLSETFKEIGWTVHKGQGQEFALKNERLNRWKRPENPAQPMAKSKVKAEHLIRPSVVKAFARGVKYLDAATRPSYVVSFEGKMAKYQGYAFDTTRMQTVFSGRGYAIWVMGADGTLYAGNHVYGQMHHSSFLSAGKILAGGEIKAKDGKIAFLSGKSGHYCPPIDSLLNALKRLKECGVEISDLRVLVWEKNHAKIVFGNAVVVDGGHSFSAWGLLPIQLKALLEAGDYEGFNSLSHARAEAKK